MKIVIVTIFMALCLFPAYGNHNLEEQAKALYDQIWDNYDSGTWSSAKAEDLFDISIGKTPPRKESQWFSENDNDIVWVSIADMGQSGCFISNSSEYLTPDAVSKFNVKRVPAGAILLSFKLTVGRVAITGCELTTNEAIAHFRMEDSTIREYLYFYLKHFNIRQGEYVIYRNSRKFEDGQGDAYRYSCQRNFGEFSFNSFSDV